MKHRYVLILLILTLACSGPDQSTTFILIRHAEKANDGTDNPDLTAEGKERARRLSELLKDTKVAAIYATNFKRTHQTVEPLAAEKKIMVRQYEAFKAEEIEKMLDEHHGETIVVCGHTNNIPWTANLLTGTDDLQEYDESQYGIFLIVTVVRKGSNARVLRLNY